MISVSLVFVIVLLLLFLFFLALARHGLVAMCVLTLVLLVVGGSVLGIRQARRRAVQMEARAVEQLLQDEQLVRQRLRAVESLRGPGPAGSAVDARRHGGPLPPPVVLVQQHPESSSSGSTTEIDSTVSIESPLPPPVVLVQQYPESSSSGSTAEIDSTVSIESLATAAVAADAELTAAEPAAAAAPLPPESSTPAPAAEMPTAPVADPGVVAASTVAAPAVAVSATRPDWVQSPPQEVAGQPAQVLVSDPFETGAECDVDMQRRIRSAIQDYADLHSTGVGAPADLNLPLHPADVRHVSRERFVDVIQTSVGPMKQVHQLIVFDESFRRVLDRRVSEAVIGQRLVRTGAFSGGILLLVGSLFGILKGGAARRQTRTVSA